MLQLYFQKLTKFLIILKNNLKLKFRYLKENIVTILRKWQTCALDVLVNILHISDLLGPNLV